MDDVERIIHRGFLAAGVENVPVTIIKETAQECLAQMKPAEWGEEDENVFKWVYNLFERSNDKWFDCIFAGCYPKVKKESVLSMLKSLRPSWKPSEEQPVYGLEEAADAHIRRVVDAAGHPGWDWTTQDIADAFKAGAEWQKAKMLKLIETRISKIVGDAQPNPVLRIELQGIIDKIK